jgi:hypothetical protein
MSLLVVIRTTCVDILKELCVSVEIVLNRGSGAINLNGWGEEGITIV